MPSHPIDVHVGGRLRQRRLFIEMSQTALGNAVGVTFQQIQKYEAGRNRIGSSRLYELAKVLDVPVSYFFLKMDANPAGKGRSRRERGRPTFPEPRIDREMMGLIRAYYKIKSTNVRASIRRLLEALAKL